MNKNNDNKLQWQLYKIVFRLLSPMHIGLRKMANINYTRYYVPAKTIWGALTNAIVKKNGIGNFQEVGEELKKSLRFTYFFFENHNGKLRLPKYEKDGMHFGDMTKADFEREFLDSYAATAIDPEHFSAEEESLHEIEIICPVSETSGAPLFLVGYVFEKKTSNLYDWQNAIKSLQIGGERKYGFGKVKGEDVLQLTDNNIFDDHDGYEIEINSQGPIVKINNDCGIPGHLKIPEKTDGLKFIGETEMLVSRETKNAEGFGKIISNAISCYSPGTTIRSNAQKLLVKFTNDFILEKVNIQE